MSRRSPKVLCGGGGGTLVTPPDVLEDPPPPDPSVPEEHRTTHYYYGHEGKHTPLRLSTDTVGVRLSRRMSIAEAVGVADTSYRLEARVSERAVEEPDARVEWMTYRIAGNDAARTDAIQELRARPEVAAVHGVFKTRSSKQSLLTNRLYVSYPNDVPQDRILAQFERDDLVVESVRRYPGLGLTGYRVRHEPSTATLAEDATLQVANAYHEDPLTEQAAPTFAPLYDTATSATPNDPYWGADDDWSRWGLENDWCPEEGYIQVPSYDPDKWDPIVENLQWNLELMNVPDVWEELYGSNFENLPSLDNAPVAAVLDNGVLMDYYHEEYGHMGTVSPGLFDNDEYEYPYCGDPGPVLPNPHLFSMYGGGHEDLNANLWENPNPGAPFASGMSLGQSNDRYGWDFVGNDPTVYDEGDPIPFPDSHPWENFHAHGTFAAGQIGAAIDNGSGVAGIAHTQIMPVRYRVITDTYHPLGDNSDNLADVYFMGRAEDGVLYAAERGAEVIALMMAVETYCPGFHNAVRVARRLGALIVNPLGNDNKSIDSAPVFPAVLDETITVGGSTNPDVVSALDLLTRDGNGQVVDSPERRANYGWAGASSYGWSLDFVVPVLTAEYDPDPQEWGDIGEFPYEPNNSWIFGFYHRGLFSTWLHAYADNWCPPNAYEAYNHGHGNSAAMPQVAGIASLLLTEDEELSPADIRALLRWTAEDLVYTTDWNGIEGEEATPGRDRYTGYGRLDAKAAYDKLVGKQAETITRAITYQPSGEPVHWTRQQNILRIDQEGDLVIDGAILEYATLDPDPNAYGTDDWTVVNNQNEVVAHLPRYWSGDAPPTLYLAGEAQFLGDGSFDPPTSPAHAWVLDGSTVGYVDNNGNMNVSGRHLIAANPNPVGHYTVGPSGDYDYTGANGIQEAIDDVPERSVILVDEGVYDPIDFQYKEVVVRSMDYNDPAVVANTVINGIGHQNRCVNFYPSVGEEAALIGFTIRGGDADYGAGIFGHGSAENPGARARIMYNHIYWNYASALGGAISGHDGLIEGNFIGHSDPNLGNYNLFGGNIHYCNGIIRQNIVRNNSTSSAGHGAAFLLCHGVIEQNLIWGNEAGGTGGGIRGCQGVIRNNIIHGNHAPSGGGGIILSDAEVIENNTIHGNTVSSGAGGVQSSNAQVFRNNIIWANDGDQILTSATPTYSAIDTETDPGGSNNIGPWHSSQDPLYADDLGFASTSFQGSFRGFLHITSTSPCRFSGDPDTHEDTGNDRDFDNQFAPWVDPSWDETSSEPRDIGADEYPTPMEAYYWYQRWE